MGWSVGTDRGGQPSICCGAAPLMLAMRRNSSRYSAQNAPGGFEVGLRSGHGVNQGEADAGLEIALGIE